MHYNSGRRERPFVSINCGALPDELLESVDWGEEAALEGLLVQKMLPPGVELIAGIHHDPQFGPLILLGSGGILVELLDDAVLRLPPLTTRQAMEMIQETRSYPLLQGYRHLPPADIPALAQLLVSLSHLAAENEHIAGLDDDISTMYTRTTVISR